MDEAIRCSMGYSNQSRYLGLEYIRALPTHPAQQIIDAIERERHAGPEHSYQARCLLVALLLKPEPPALEYALQQVRAFLDLEPKDIDWKQLPDRPTVAGEFLTALLGCTRASWSPAYFPRYRSPRKEPLTELREKELWLLLAAYPRLNASAVADVTYALCITGASRPEALLPLLKDSPEKEGFALGLYYLENKMASCWAWKTAGPLLTQASILATRPEFKEQISKELDHALKWAGPVATQPGTLADIAIIEDDDAEETENRSETPWNLPLWGLGIGLSMLVGTLLVVTLIARKRRASRHQGQSTTAE